MPIIGNSMRPLPKLGREVLDDFLKIMESPFLWLPFCPVEKSLLSGSRSWLVALLS